MKKILSLLLGLLLIFNLSLFAPTKTETAVSALNSYNLTEKIEDGVILHAWCWSFNTIKQNLPEIAAAGYSAIQTSPINEVLPGEGGGMQLSGNGKWYYLYQPTNYTIGNYVLGTEQEFKDLCTEADKYGIKIVVDAVLNHCTTDYNAINQSVKNITANPFHSNGGVNDYTNRWNITQASLNGLHDFNTQDSAVQQYMLNYLNRVLAAGADGFRFDAAKHIELPTDDASFRSNFWPVVTNNAAEFQYLEVLQDSNGTDNFSNYANYGSVTASTYGYIIRESVDARDLSINRINNYYASGVSADKLVTWVESHDNYCNDRSWELTDEKEIKWAWAVLAARGQTTPLFFPRPNGATNANIWGNNLMGAVGSPLYKDSDIVAVNHFHNAMGDAGERLSNPNGNKGVLMIERGSKGAVIVNTTTSAINLSNADTALADGTYTDKISGSTFTVSSGKISGTVQSEKIAVFYKSEDTPTASANVASGDFYDSVSVTLSVSNANTSTYSINGGAEIPFNNGQTLTLGADLAIGQSVTLRLTAQNAYGTTQRTFTYTKVKKPSIEGTVVYFDNSSYNWQNVYCYVYNSGGYTNGAWPGVAMTKKSDNLYYYVLDPSIPDGLVMFNNGNNVQYPASGQAGLSINKNEQKILKGNYSWEKYVEESSLPCDLHVSSVACTTATPQEGNAVTFSATVRNVGDNATDTSFQVQFYVDGILRETVTFTETINAGSFKRITTILPWTAFFGSHTVKANVIPNDLQDINADNNYIKSRFQVLG